MSDEQVICGRCKKPMPPTRYHYLELRQTWMQTFTQWVICPGCVLALREWMWGLGK